VILIQSTLYVSVTEFFVFTKTVFASYN
jgi:hypothetical protein